MVASSLPLPRLAARTIDSIPLFTDDALYGASSVRIAFTGRAGGASEGDYASLNLGTHVGDDRDVVLGNRRALLCALGEPDMPLVVPNQVHGTDLVNIVTSDPEALRGIQNAADAGADGLVVSCPRVAALLCFADCVPVIIVSPTGRVAVVHAGWRGAVARIASSACKRLAALDARELGHDAPAPSEFNAYIGPHICASCFETGPDVAQRFASEIGPGCVPDARHVDLEQALILDFESAGLSRERIASAHSCTKCEPDRFFSYRASGGVCGRHGALAFRSR